MSSPPSARAKLDALVAQEGHPLFSVRSVFPFHFFPKVVSVDRKKISITDHVFLGAAQVQSVLVVDIATLVVETSLMFAELTIHDKLPGHKPIRVDYLPKRSTQKLHRIVEGLLIADRSGIDVTQISDAELVSKLEELGRAQG